MKKFGKKKILLGLVVGVFIVFVAWMGVDYYQWNKAVKAVGGFPWQDGGTITAYQPVCVLTNGVCSNCTFCPPSYCAGHSQISYNGQIGGPSAFMCVPTGFIYSGGGTTPRIGGSIIAGGIANMGAMIKVIGISK